MITTSLMITAFAFFTNSRKDICLNMKAGRFFQISGIILAIHYIVSSAFFFIIRYDGSYKYFGGYRYIPAYTVFVLQGLVVAYSCIAIIIAKPDSRNLKAQLQILRKLIRYVGILFPLIFIFDLVRYFFPPLWNILPEERLILTPLCFSILNLYLIKYTQFTFRLNPRPPSLFPNLSRRESEVAQLLCAGKRYRDIADELHISMATVQTHVTRIYEKTGVNRKEELIIQNNIN